MWVVLKALFLTSRETYQLFWGLMLRPCSDMVYLQMLLLASLISDLATILNETSALGETDEVLKHIASIYSVFVYVFLSVATGRAQDDMHHAVCQIP